MFWKSGILVTLLMIGVRSQEKRVDSFSSSPSSSSSSSSVRWRRQSPLLYDDTLNNMDLRDTNAISPPRAQSVTAKDNRKPAFRDCRGYTPSVKEEKPHGEFVIQVDAVDVDEQDTIEYSFVTTSERPKFRIDSKTGVIKTLHTFDRDEPIREKEVYITVRATDNGRPPLDDVCTFKVAIEDINDNPPVFDKGKYDESMSEDIDVNKEVVRISASDLDDGDNSIVKYELLPGSDSNYFRIDENNGRIHLVRPIDKRPGQHYSIYVRALNIVKEMPQDAEIEIKIRVIESNKRPPVFIDPPTDTITLKENFADFGQTLISLRAISNVPDKPELIFELITGRTGQTNKDKQFVFNQTDDTVTITLGKPLDFEAITSYTLTMSVRNTYDLFAEHFIKIEVEDVNDNIPYFTDVNKGTISENEDPGTPVMQVRAFDMDGTIAHNIVSFELADNTEFFTIDRQTGNITALVSFDREAKDSYNVKVIATDNSPSALYNTGVHNMGQQVFHIEIADKNDHRPQFQNDEYLADKLPEDANINFLVIEVTAVDRDDASQITYTIIKGNIGDAFKIESSTGKISVNKELDYEVITEYSLRIRAFDGIYEDYTTVKIRIEDVNDNPPVFEGEYSTTIEEEKVVDGCILKITAFDPDIKDRNSPQNIKYEIVKAEQQSLLQIDNDGCLSLIKPLDRDLPNGHKDWQVIVAAADLNGNGLRSVTDVTITLTDVNDNAPFLTNKMPVVWYENQGLGTIVQLTANDYDEPHNGPPFRFEIDQNASEDIHQKFSITGDHLFAMGTFDREQQKEYHIPIAITDSGEPNMRNVSELYLIIGDVNDNPMQDGVSSIFVYNYKGEAPDTEIGRVYVDDLDDWDLPDKSFNWKEGIRDDRFSLNTDSGMITMKEGIAEGDYHLYFKVTEESRQIPKHSVTAEVVVTVRKIPEEAVDKSGSIRFWGITAEEFITIPKDGSAGGLSKKDLLQLSLARQFNVSVEFVDVFTVLKSDQNSSVLDVRFSAHGSPYYEAERLNGMVALHQATLEEELGLKMLMINIDECLVEKVKCESSCMNILHKSNVPLLVYTNQTSFVGVNAFIQAECVCVPPTRVTCLNGGTFYNNVCECPDGFDGPHCELSSIGFYGSGYALYKPIAPCDSTKISLELAPQREEGLVMYIGPMSYNPLLPIQDYLALELVKGFPVLTVDYGTGSTTVDHSHIRLSPGKTYLIEIILQRKSVEMTVDNCKLSKCMNLGAPVGPNEFLNVNAPLQLGGAAVNLELLATQFNWTHTPMSAGYSGCIHNLRIDGETYNIGAPSVSKNADPGCLRSIATAVSFGIDQNFLVAVIVCIALLLILLLAVVVHKRHQDGWPEKDTDDIRETIINYEDEGGGERDTDFDLNVLRAPPIYEDKPYRDELRLKEAAEVPDIGGFLVDKKDSCDKDYDAHPVDNVRKYAYEGDGNSSGSLSSLASCTDDGDLKFDYLSNFGPRFRKLADMYGEEPSDTDSNGDADEGWRI